jgi:glutamyl-tRNA synthetase
MTSSSSPIVVRFAPSPTGYLHIGGARTALFNWLYAKHTGGQCLLRIEDTDTSRSSQEAVDAIHKSLHWLGLSFDGDVVYQSKRAKRHREVAFDLLKKGHAYKCYCTAEELDAMRQEAHAQKIPFKYDRRWRAKILEKSEANEPPFTIRLKMPLEGTTIINDRVQGTVTTHNTQLDDMILLRSDGTPTYMLAVVVDDHDMGITHIIRGDDHLNNAFRQIHIYHMMEWKEPVYAHIPLIHGSDGAKMSKRHGATSLEDYKDDYLPEAMRNYLLRLGWGKGDIELISTEDAIAVFDLDDIGRSPARFDAQKLQSFNAHYIKQCDNTRLMAWVLDYHHNNHMIDKHTQDVSALELGLNDVKDRSKTLKELAHNSLNFLKDPAYTRDDANVVAFYHTQNTSMLQKLLESLKALLPFNHETVEICLRTCAKNHGVKLKDVAQPLRIALWGGLVSPSLFHIIEYLGIETVVRRIQAFIRFVESEDASESPYSL